MDIIYHRNCLDGIYSSYVVYLLSRVVAEGEIVEFQKELLEMRAKGSSNITDDVKSRFGEAKQISKGQAARVTEQFFHEKRGVNASAYSIFAGEYYPLKFPGGSKVLFILDTNLVSAKNISQLCQSHELVIMIDHHTSFKQFQKQLDSLELKNLVYIFDEGHCASTLTLNFVQRFFSFRSRFQQKFMSDLQEELGYVQKNDLKRGETRQSKSFVLGFYYFDIQMSHLNPNLYKRLGMLDLDYLLGKGKNLYESHIVQLKQEVANTKVLQFNMNGFFKDKRCFYLQPRNPAKISDIGTVLAFLSADSGLLNLAVLAMKKDYDIRVSCRSHRSKGEPMALELAKKFEGGGHTEAAGFKIGGNDFRGRFKILSASTVATRFDISVEDVQRILFGENEQMYAI